MNRISQFLAVHNDEGSCEKYLKFNHKPRRMSRAVLANLPPSVHHGAVEDADEGQKGSCSVNNIENDNILMEIDWENTCYSYAYPHNGDISDVSQMHSMCDNVNAMDRGQEELYNPLRTEEDVIDALEGDSSNKSNTMYMYQLGRIQGMTGEGQNSKENSYRDAVIKGCGMQQDSTKQRCLRLCRGGYIGVVGTVGSGKTTLLLGLLNEICHSYGYHARANQSGNVHSKYSICPSITVNPITFSYAPQTPCIHNGTLFSNIIFGSNYDKHRYWEVVKGCGLLPDVSRKHGYMLLY